MSFSISAIIPNYRRADLLCETLESILAQTYPAKEIVVVDDGSPDGAADVVERRYGKRVRVVRQENRGVNAARSRAADEAKYPWLALCDNDDLWLPTKLERQVALLEKAPDVRYCATDFCVFTEGGDGRNHFSYAPPGYWDMPRRDFGKTGFVVDCEMYFRLLEYQPIHPSSVLIHREALEKAGGFDEAMSGLPADDFEFHLRCAQHPPFAFVPQLLMRYRRHEGCFSADVLASHACGADILEYALKRHRRAFEEPERVRRVIRQTLIESAEMAFYLERLEKVRAYAARVEHPPWKLRAYAATCLLPEAVHLFLRRALRRPRGTLQRKPARTTV